MAIIAPYGSWESSVTSDIIASGTVEIGQIAIDDGDLYWTETRPSENGRTVLVHRTPDGITSDETPLGFDVRTLVHEYGGGAFSVSERVVYFSNYEDQCIYQKTPGVSPKAITPIGPMRYADIEVDSQRRRIVCVREDHSNNQKEAVNTLVSINLERLGEGEIIAAGKDFYSSPRLSPGKSKIAWVSWDHPNMPWDGTELWIGELSQTGSIKERHMIAGGDDESILEPRWSPDGKLYFISDRTGWWNIYRWWGGTSEPVCQMDAEFASTPWRLGGSTYAFETDDRIVCAYNNQGVWRIATITTENGHLEDVKTPFTDVSRMGIRAHPGHVIIGAGSPEQLPCIVDINLDTNDTQVLKRSSEFSIPPQDLSRAHPIEFPTENNLSAHAFLYRPINSKYQPPEGDKPPLIIISHGGPTGAATSSLKMDIQFWTSRGFSVVDVNYRGSSGYGTNYRRRLNGQWGIVDVEDCVNAVKYLVAMGEVDSNRVAIKGSSAGGYTTLSALTFTDTFNAGSSHFGISDLEAMTKETHKFESRYLDTMIGTYSEHRDLYIDRSPIHHTERLSCPVILFQGLEDKVVPPNQAMMMVDALRKKGIPVAYMPFEGEQHGFRSAGNIKRTIDAELYFFSRIFGFGIDEQIEPVHIENLD